MNYSIIKKLTPIDEIIKAYPLSARSENRIKEDREEVKEILEGKDKRLLMIVGPCSAWPKDAVVTYAEKLSEINKKIKHVIKLIMRVYIQKPRTTKGWMGPVNQPNPFFMPDIETGIRYAREMMVKIVEMGLPISDEALFTHNAKGFLELLTWVAIGARSAENQEHRVFASALDCAVGIKNPTHGSLLIGVNSVVAAQHPHVTVFEGHEVQTFGNPHAHLVLRGSNYAPNYSLKHLEEVKNHMDRYQIKNPSIVIDVSHDNCLLNGNKNHRLQPMIVFEVLESLRHRSDLQRLVKGFMIESFIKDGNQTCDNKCSDQIDFSGLSLTDPCLSWEHTETFLIELATRLEKNQ